jgi:hypothetical protein
VPHIDKDNGPVNALAPGQRVGPFEVLSLDPGGKRAVVACPCGGVHIFSVESLLAGVAACPVLPLTPQQREQMNTEIRKRNRLKEAMTALRDWKPNRGRS